MAIYKMMYFATGQEQKDLMKTFWGHLDLFEAELVKRGTQFLGGQDLPGMIDYMVWTHLERIDVLPTHQDLGWKLEKSRFPKLVIFKTSRTCFQEISFEDLAFEELDFEEHTFEELAFKELTFKELTFDDLVSKELAFEELTLEELAFEEFALEELAFEELAFEELAFEELTFEELAFEELAFEELAFEELIYQMTQCQ
jgi:hypothetical protein